MKKLLVFTAMQLLLISMCAYAGDMTAKDVSEIVGKLKAGKSVGEFNKSLGDQTQQIGFRVGQLYYLIDYRAKLCFAIHSEATSVPCKALKDGYPVLAPIIDWEK